MATIFERLKRVVVERIGVDEDKVVLSASFAKDLGADSIELVEFTMSLEDEFSNPSREIRIPDEAMEKMVTVQDAVNYLRSLGIGDNGEAG